MAHRKARSYQHVIFHPLFLMVLFLTGTAIQAQGTGDICFSPGSQERQLGVHTSPEGPNSGPLSILCSGDGLVILDSFNHRLLRTDSSGAFKGSIPLPANGRYKDMARLANGQIWVIDEADRAAFRISGGGVHQAFLLPNDSGPRQIDALVGLGEQLAVIDFRTRAAYFLTTNGLLTNAASIPAALSFVADAQNRLCFLALSESKDDNSDSYDRLIRISAGGKTAETRLPGKGWYGARLIGFTNNNQPIILTVDSWEPIHRRLLICKSDGTHETIAECDYPLLFATRYGSVGSNRLWLNLSPIDARQLVFRLIHLP